MCRHLRNKILRNYNKALNFYSPLRYPGGKNGLFSFVSTLIEENNYKNKIYAEPFAGGCGLALKLLFEGVIDEIYLNDYDYSIYSFWNTILTRATEFCSWIEDVEISIENWRFFKNILDNQSDFDQFEIAKATFFLNRTNISGVIKGGVIGGQNQNGKYKIDARFNKIKLIEKIKLIYSKRNFIHFYNLDALVFLNKIKEIKSLFIYLDPPYFIKGSELYLNFYTTNDHIYLHDFLKDFKCDFILSYDNNDFIKNTYNNYIIYTFVISQSTSNKIGKEILLFSKNIVFKKSIKLLKNPKKVRQKFTPIAIRGSYSTTQFSKN